MSPSSWDKSVYSCVACAVLYIILKDPNVIYEPKVPHYFIPIDWETHCSIYIAHAKRAACFIGPIEKWKKNEPFDKILFYIMTIYISNIK